MLEQRSAAAPQRRRFTGYSATESLQAYRSLLRGHLLVGGRVVLRVIADPFKGEGMWKATEAWLESDFEAECAI